MWLENAAVYWNKKIRYIYIYDLSVSFILLMDKVLMEKLLKQSN